jgi:hypothetical protein
VTKPPGARAVDLADKLSLFSEHWSPKVVARLDDPELKLVKVKGEFVWHRHEKADELFLVLDGTLVIRLLEGDVTLRAGQADGPVDGPLRDSQPGCSRYKLGRSRGMQVAAGYATPPGEPIR